VENPCFARLTEWDIELLRRENEALRLKRDLLLRHSTILVPTPRLYASNRHVPSTADDRTSNLSRQVKSMPEKTLASAVTNDARDFGADYSLIGYHAPQSKFDGKTRQVLTSFATSSTRTRPGRIVHSPEDALKYRLNQIEHELNMLLKSGE